MAHHPRRLLLALVLGVLGLLLAVPSAGAAPSSGRGGIDVIQVDGLLDPPNAQLIRDALRVAQQRGSSLVVIKVASGGAVDVDVRPLVADIRRSKVPVAVWVGPSGAKGKGASALLAAAAPVAAVSSGSTIGPADPLLLDDPGATDVDRLEREMAALSVANGRRAAGGRAMATRQLSSTEAARLGAVDRVCPQRAGCPTLGDLVVGLDGRTVQTAAGPRTLDTAKVVGQGQDRRRQVNQEVRFRKLDLGGQAVHTLTSPSIAYLLFVVGLSLIVFELFTISIGLAGGAGALAVIGACVGFSHLPFTWLGIALLLLAMFGFAVDVQVGRPAVWSAIASIALVVGSLVLYGGSASLDVHWWVIVLVVVGTLLFMIGGLPIAVRSRFSTPTVGREALVGEMGEAAVAVAPDGVVVVRGARWRARTNRATPIAAGAPIRVVEVDGLVLEVEPEEGGARDYREMRKRRVGEGPEDAEA